MTSMMRIRLWLKEAPGPERRLWLAAALLACLLVAWAIVPANRDDASLLSSGGGASGYDNSGSPTGEGVPGTDDVPANPDGSPISTSTSSVVGSTGTGGRTSSTGGSRTGPGTQGGGGNTDPTPGPTDASPIKIGIAMFDYAKLEQTGVATGAVARGDQSKAIDAYIDDLNKRGGIHGRRVTAIKEYVNIQDENDQRAKCLKFTATEKVMAVLDSATFATESTKACITVEHKTPLVNFRPTSRSYTMRAFPNDVSLYKDDNRIMKDMVLGAKDAGFFDESKGFRKLGILSDSCVPSALDDPQIGLKAYLRSINITSWNEVRMACDTGAQQRDAGQAAVEHHLDDVTHVLLVANALGVVPYLKAAQSTGFKPQLYVSDFNGLINDNVGRLMDQDAFDGARGVTITRYGEQAAGNPFPPAVQRCSKILTDHGLPGITNYAYDQPVLFSCDNLAFFEAIAKAAGANVNRQSFGPALPKLGDFPAALTEKAVFGPPDKVTGGDAVHPVQWFKACNCFKQTGPKRPAYG